MLDVSTLIKDKAGALYSDAANGQKWWAEVKVSPKIESNLIEVLSRLERSRPIYTIARGGVVAS